MEQGRVPVYTTTPLLFDALGAHTIRFRIESRRRVLEFLSAFEYIGNCRLDVGSRQHLSQGWRIAAGSVRREHFAKAPRNS